MIKRVKPKSTCIAVTPDNDFMAIVMNNEINGDKLISGEYWKIVETILNISDEGEHVFILERFKLNVCLHFDC